MKIKSFLLIIILSVLFSCRQEQALMPKPRLFPKIDFPEKEYQKFEEGYCNMTFDYPSYAHIEKEDNFFNEAPLHPCWFDIVVPSLNSRIHCSYIELNSQNDFDKAIKDAFNLAGKHNIKADYRDEMVIKKSEDVSGIIFDLHGPVATPAQFFLTDSTKHFVRGALYFNNKVQPDSMAPVYEFMKQDIARLVESFEWVD